ncbi:MAG: AEC family transporter [Candidatus Lokiarchaeota archaeon]|nr:AEC family transporter [Candidatus Lokiarchaeota archaeon]
MADINIVFLISLMIIAIGYFLKRTKILTEENGEVIARIIFNLTLPAVILKVTSTITFEITLILLPLINILFGLFMVLIGLVVFKKYPKNMKGLLLMSIIGFNVANFSFPLIEGIWGESGLQLIAMVDAGNAVSIFIICFTMGRIYSPKSEKSENKNNFKDVFSSLLKSVPLISYIVAIIINFSGILMPFFLTELIDMVSRANSPLALLLLGVFLNFKFQKDQWMMIGKSLLIRYTLGLSFGLLLFFLLPAIFFSELFRIIITISLILPVGLAVIPFSVELEYDKKLITIIVNLSILISFGLMWILIVLFSG